MNKCTVEKYLGNIVSTINESIQECKDRIRIELQKSKKIIDNETDFIECMKSLKSRILGRTRILIDDGSDDYRDVVINESTIMLKISPDGIEAFYSHNDTDAFGDIRSKMLSEDTANAVLNIIVKDKKQYSDKDIIKLIEKECESVSGVSLDDIKLLKSYYKADSKRFNDLCLSLNIHHADMRYLYANNMDEIV
jgi:hypothetical protein